MGLDYALLIRTLSAKGLSTDDIAHVVETMQGKTDDQRREKARIRQARHREKVKSEVTHVTPVTVTRVTPSETKVSPLPSSKTQTTHLPPSPPKGGSGSITKAFENVFWPAYPRKVGKGAARKSFERAWRKIEAADPAPVLLGALDRVKPTWTDPQFIPHPATWLNQERWEDGPPLNGTTVRNLEPIDPGWIEERNRLLQDMIDRGEA